MCVIGCVCVCVYDFLSMCLMNILLINLRYVLLASSHLKKNQTSKVNANIYSKRIALKYSLHDYK